MLDFEPIYGASGEGMANGFSMVSGGENYVPHPLSGEQSEKISQKGASADGQYWLGAAIGKGSEPGAPASSEN